MATDTRYRLIIFDFDGTLADSFPWFVRIFNEVADRFRFARIDADGLEALRSLSSREMVRHVGVPSWKLPLIARYVRKLKARDLHTVGLFPGTDGLLRQLSDAGIVLAIVSSNAEKNVRRILGSDRAGHIRYFECGASLFGKRRSFRRVLKRSGFAPRDVLCIGDEIRDLEAARMAGLPFGAVGWGYTTPTALRAHAPEEWFESMGEIVDVVTSRTARLRLADLDNGD